jgi:hypothetical protein
MDFGFERNRPCEHPPSLGQWEFGSNRGVKPVPRRASSCSRQRISTSQGLRGRSVKFTRSVRSDCSAVVTSRRTT